MYSDQALQRADLRERFRTDPAAALADLHATLPVAIATNRLFALAELSFLHAEATGARPYYVAAAVYAYAFLFPEDAASQPDPLDPRQRMAADTYNRGLAEGLMSADGQRRIACLPSRPITETPLPHSSGPSRVGTCSASWSKLAHRPRSIAA